MGVELLFLNFLIGFVCWALATQDWFLVTFLAAFEVLWALLAYQFGYQSFLLNDVLLLFISVAVLFLSAVELVLGIGTLLLVYHYQRRALL